MFAKLYLSLCIFGVVRVNAYPQEYQRQGQALGEWHDVNDKQSLPEYAPLKQIESQRFYRQLNVQGGGSPRQGFDLSINTRVPVWQSNNGRHSFDATGQYSQHLGGPYGNSPPNWGAGGVYTFRF